MNWTFEATGTIWQIEFLEEKDTIKIKDKIVSQVNLLENIFSRFKKESELSQLNQNKILSHPSQDLWHVLNLSLKCAKITNNLFTPFIGKELVQNGYGQEFKSSEKTDYVRLFTPNKITIKKDDILDLGSLAKGYIIQQVAKILLENDFKYFVINGGGDIYLTSNNQKPIFIGIENPETQKWEISIELKNSAICSSANNRRVWDKNGQKYAHIITQNNIKGVTVIHPNCCICDMLSTCIFVSDIQFIDNLKEEFGDFRYKIFR